METEEWFYNNTSSDFRNDKPNQNDKVHRSNYNTRRQDNQAQNGSKNTTYHKRNNRDRNFRSEEENTNKNDKTWEQSKNEEYHSKFPTLADARKTEVRKQKPTLGKFTRISKQRKPIEMVEIKTPERKTRQVSINESDEIQVVFETDTSNGDFCRSGKSNDNFLFHGQGATNSAQTQGCHNPGESWKVLELEKGPGKSWNFTYFCLKSWKGPGILYSSFHVFIKCKHLKLFGILLVVFPSNIFYRYDLCPFYLGNWMFFLSQFSFITDCLFYSIGTMCHFMAFLWPCNKALE